MFLKRLEITGFKSFAGRTVLDFDKSDQIAAIVGPNGSGKSNIADAIRWALGETSYKSLRSKKSEDVIFSGSEAKNRASMAKVTVVLDNQDKKAPIEFSELSISRGVYRDGSSEYLLAGKKARLLDVAELLAKSGFGQSTYTVIGQGMVDSMLFYGPAERKVLFDEAAGVRAYELKREQTLKKLEETNSNLIRIKDILAELSPRLANLKRQAERANEKDRLKNSLIEKQKTYYATIWDRYNISQKEKRKDLEKITIEQRQIEQEIANLNQKFNEILEEEKNTKVSPQSLNDEVAKLEEQKDIFRQKIFTLRARKEISESGFSTKELKDKISALKDQIQKLELEKLEKKHKSIKNQINSISVEELNKEIQNQEKTKDDLMQQIFILKSELSQEKKLLSAKEIEEKVRQLKSEYQNLNDKELLGRIKGHEKEIKRDESRIVEIEKEVEETKEKLNSLAQQINKIDMGQVGEQLSAILYMQNDFVIQIESARDLKEVANALSTGKQVSERLKNLRKLVGESKQDKLSKISAYQAELESLLSEKEKLTKQISHKKSEIFRYDFEVKKIGDRKFEIEKELGIINAQKPAEESQKRKIETKIQKLEEHIKNINTEVNNLRAKIEQRAKYNADLLHIEYQIKHEKEKERQLESEIKRLESIKPTEGKEKDKIEAEIETNQAKIAKLNIEIDKIKAEIIKQNNIFSSQGKLLSEIKDSISEKQSLLSEYNHAETAIKIELGKIETKKQDTREEITRELGSEEILAGAVVVPELDQEKSRAEIERLKNKLYAIGEIDPEVEIEYGEVFERVEFMNKQTEDLEKAKGDLEKLVKELDLKIKKQFESSFEAISKKFSHFFETLFEGGTAKLELVKSKNEDALEGAGGEKDEFGIEITAVPPGKRVKSLSALSGGERTMTSLALLFAILSVNPSPFCVLDEVDAALDEANTKRFLKIIKELASSTQFIFITHNRETMKIAGVIYGVTMDDSHASKLLSIKLDDALKPLNSIN